MTSGITPSILWREGVFLCPQHLQAFAREIGGRAYAGDRHGVPGSFGAARLEIDEEALERDVFRIVEAEILFRDGTLLSVPHNAEVLLREFGEHWDGPQLLVYLGVPAVQENVPQVGEGDSRLFRYEVDVRKVYDENQRDSARELEFRTLRAHLFFGDEDRSGHESVPIARLVRRGSPETVSALCPSYVAPVLRCGASKALAARLKQIAERARGQARDLAAVLPDVTRLSSVDSSADVTGLIKLQSVNRGLAVLEQVATVPDVHPFDAYVEIVRAVGELAVFGSGRVTPELPAYAHDQLDECFSAGTDALLELLAAEVSVPYDVVAFEEDPAQEGVFYAAIPPEWLAADPLFYLGVGMGQPQEAVADLVSAGVKLLAPGDLENVLQGVLPGIELTPLRLPPPSFPKRDDLHFFRVGTEDASRDLWLNVIEAKKATILSALGSIENVEYSLYVELRG